VHYQQDNYEYAQDEMGFVVWAWFWETEGVYYSGGDAGMKFVCSKCCDDDGENPCELKIPNKIEWNREDYLIGLCVCPFESSTFKKGKWRTTGEYLKAEWRLKE
jgi:hypothetical protein